MRFLLVCISMIAMIIAGQRQALAERRLALVIGNAHYQMSGNLENPISDARAMGDMLRGLGFEVVEGIDLDRAGMQAAIGKFAKRLEGADIALFYYAGHGIQVDGRNLLIPTDAEIETESDLALATIPLQVIQQQMADAPRVKLVILDACRDNPFHDQLQASLPATRALSTPDGLAPVSLADDTGGTFIAFATDPGAYAQDGHGKPHSPFTQALLTHMPKPGIELHEMMIDVRSDVWKDTQETQRPWSNSSLTGKVYLGARPVEISTASSPAAVELALWEAASEGGTAAEYHAYLQAYPDGVFSALAEIRLTAALGSEDPVDLANVSLLDHAPDMRRTRRRQVPKNPSWTLFKATMDKPASEPLTRPERSAMTPEPDSDPELSGNPEPQVIPEPKADPKPPAARRSPQEMEERVLAALEARKAVQSYLEILGFEPGTHDGIFGPKTRAAIGAWQKSAEKEQTGFLTGAQLAELKNDAASNRYAALAESSTTLISAPRPAARSPRVQPQTHQRAKAPEGLLDQALREIEANFRASYTAPSLDPGIRSLLNRQRFSLGRQ